MTSKTPTTRDLRIFGIAVGLAFAAIGQFLLSEGMPRWALFALGGALFITGAVRPVLLKVIYGPWMTMAGIMGAIVTRVLLTVFYFTVLLPFTLIRFGDPLRLKVSEDTGSFWEKARNPETTIERFRRPF